MACRSCISGRASTVPRTNTRRVTGAGKKQSWVVVYRSDGQDVEQEFSGGNSDYLAACREAGKHQGRVWPKSLWTKQKQKKEGGGQ